MSYPPVVASGPDAFYTHYGRNDKVLAAGQMVLMDAGCERHGYASDVTRTWPISGKFSGPQRAVYDIVLDVHQRYVQQGKDRGRQNNGWDKVSPMHTACALWQVLAVLQAWEQHPRASRPVRILDGGGEVHDSLRSHHA